MNRILTLAAVFLFATSTFGETKQRYLIATRGPAAIASQKIARTSESNVRAFANVDAYAADLTESEAATLKASGEVRYLAPVVERSIASDARPLMPVSGGSKYEKTQSVPYGIDKISARGVWTASRGAGNVNVVVADTGIDYNHPDLKDRYAGGYNVYKKNNDPMDDFGHGTHVAGTIAAIDNEIGVVGVAPQVRLWAVKVLNENGNGNDESIIAGMDWVISKKHELGGNWIVNLSLGSTLPSDVEREAFRRVIQEGIIVVAAAGNRGTGRLDVPAAYQEVLAITAINYDDTLADFSSHGPGTAFTAPGVAVLSTVPVGFGIAHDVESDSGRLYTALPLVGSSRGEITATAVNCGFGYPEQIPANVAGKIAIVMRSPTAAEFRFRDKVLNVIQAGAAAVIVIPNDGREDRFRWTLLGEEGDQDYPWPVVLSVDQSDAQAISVKAGSEMLTISNRTENYAIYNGTSMASPHVAGTAALVWSLAPKATAEQIRLAMKLTAFDIGAPGYDTVYGYGRVDALKAAQYVAPSEFGVPPPPPPPHNRRRPGQ
ncbi:MAG: S8 family serine peptidase [Thermoanaerobaculia bacterium]|nr:S8 family serine peptidase [Thermoanaerobaculia bacterium]